MGKLRLGGDSAGYIEISAPSNAGNNTITLPTGNGTNNQALLTDSSGVTYWSDVLVTSGNTITGNVVFASGFVSSGNITLNAQADLRFGDSDSSNWVAFQAPATIGSNVTWTLPSGDGISNQYLVTDGSGNLSWATNLSITRGMSYFYAGF